MELTDRFYKTKISCDVTVLQLQLMKWKKKTDNLDDGTIYSFKAEDAQERKVRD